ncbi:molybdenum cofactor guanylyltransferase [Novosphingobium percolationis]|uniref:molybdenum cofactor guanylyltransferase n=1 Tax=Novosphingobium percolationis TaxID=2871811 RepID=UPI001CD2C69C|nr:molybdenum cofactor guanylyltransferase [Novosphingobium percolationis]
MILGAILAGGQSRRFGRDKALAELGGQTLLARAVDALAPLCDAVVVVGRSVAPAPTLPDWPGPGMGPLGGIAAALHHATDAGYDAVLTCAVDSVGVGEGLLADLSPAPAYSADQPVIGLWPASATAILDALLEGDGRRSMRVFAEAIGARAVTLSCPPANINTLEDLAAAERRHGL